MAKSFKKGPTTGSTPPKPTSERDFFDFLDAPVAEPVAGPAGSEPVPALLGAAELVPSGNTGKQEMPSDTLSTEEQASALKQAAPDVEPSREVVAKPTRRRPVAEQLGQPIEKPAAIAASPVAPQPDATAASVPRLLTTDNSQGVRQTFVVGAQFLEQLRDFVHAQRAAGAYWYSQRQALEEGLVLLFATRGPVAQRPDHIQAWEQERRTRIQEGRRAGRTPEDSQAPLS